METSLQKTGHLLGADYYQGVKQISLSSEPASPYAKDPEVYAVCLCGHDNKDHKEGKNGGMRRCNSRAWYEEARCGCRGFEEYQYRDFAASPMNRVVEK